MAAPLGFKTFTTGDVLTATDTNGYLMQGVWTFASAVARTTAVTSPQEGNISYLKDTDSIEYYSGSAWVAVAGASGSLTLLSTTSVTSATTTVSSISGSYKFLKIYLTGFGTTDANPGLAITFNGASTFQGVRIQAETATGYGPAGLSDSSLNSSYLYSGANGAAYHSSVITLDNYTNTTNHKPVTYSENFYSSSGTYVGGFYSGKLKTTAAITSMTATWGGTTGMTGTIKIYGGN